MVILGLDLLPVDRGPDRIPPHPDPLGGGVGPLEIDRPRGWRLDVVDERGDIEGCGGSGAHAGVRFGRILHVSRARM